MVKNIVLIGGGHAHALVLRTLADNPLPGVTIHVFDPQPRVAYSGMLPGYIAGHYGLDDMYIDILALTKAAGGVFHQMKVDQIDVVTKTIQSHGERYSYDLASFDIGIHTAYQAVPGAQDYAVGVKPLTDFATQWEQFLLKKKSTTTKKIVVVGGGVAGVEVTLAMAYRLWQETGLYHDITMIEQATVLKQLSDTARQELLRALQKYNISIIESASATQITAQTVILDSHTTLKSDFTLFATGPHPYDWISQTAIPVTEGYITVGPTLQSTVYPELFAVGDCAHFSPRPLPKAGVYAVRQAPILYHNIRAKVLGQALKPFVPQSDYLKLISLGQKKAMADKWGITLSSHWLWQLKHTIDKRFMNHVSCTNH